MPFLIDAARDSGLTYVSTNGTRLDICSTEPTTYAQATSTASLGNKTGIVIAAPSDGAVDGRRVIVPPVTDGSVTVTGTATHWALTNGSNTLIATGALNPSQGVTSGNTFTTTAISITIRDAA
jgi:hypothetical protein